jgi:O-antigen ligase
MVQQTAERTATGPRNAFFVPSLVLAGAVAGALLVAGLGPVLSLATAAVVPVALLVLSDVKVALGLTFCALLLLPFGTLPLDIGFVPTFVEVGILTTLVVLALSLLANKRDALYLGPVGVALALFMGLMVASFVLGLAHSRPTVTSLRRFADMILSLAFYYVVVNALYEQRQVERAYWLLVTLGALAALIGVVLYLVPTHVAERLLNALGVIGYPRGAVLRYIEDNPELPLRAIGTSVDPNVFGGTLALLGGLLTPQLFAPRPRRVRLLLWGGMGLIFLALLLTFSRGSMLGLAFAAVAFAGVRERRLIAPLVAAGALVLLLPATRQYVQHFAEGLQGQDLATQMRFGEYKDALILISRYPAFGVGFTGVPDVDIYLGVSSVYLLVAEEMGLIGLAAFLCLFLTFLATTWPAARKARSQAPALEPIILGTQTAVVAGLVAGMLDHYLFNLSFPHAAALLWSIVGVGCAAARLSRALTARQRGHNMVVFG